jgi:hypothetical protein
VESLRGIICALCTPMNGVDGSVDMKGLERHIDRMLEAGMDGILVCGGTGEFAMQRAGERRRIAEAAARRIDGQAKFLIHVSAVNTEETTEFARHARDCGADAMLVLPPYFEGPDAEGVYRHFARVADAVPAIIIFLPIVTHLVEVSGADPVHAGLVVVMTLAMGLITPPYGLCLLLAWMLGKMSVGSVMRQTMVFYVLFSAVLLLVILVPDISLYLPRLFLSKFM